MISSPERFEEIHIALEPILANSPGAIDDWSTRVLATITKLRSAADAAQFSVLANEIHGLAQQHADLLVNAINSLEPDSAIMKETMSALSTMVVAISQAESTQARDSSAFEHAPEHVRQGWLKLLMGAPIAEAGALYSTLPTLRVANGLPPTQSKEEN